jgi:hypothetical protein
MQLTELGGREGGTKNGKIRPENAKSLMAKSALQRYS